jgi:Zn-dependent protease with chaperone function
VGRLNPFAFPSETDFRFAQLIVSVVSASLILFTTLFNSLPWTWEWKRERYAACTAQVQAAYAPRSAMEYVDATAAMGRCTAPTDRAEAVWLVSGGALIALVSGAIYWLLPAWKLRRDGLVALTAEDDPDMLDYLRSLSGEVGLSTPPQFVWDPLRTSVNGVAFGRFRRYYVALSGGLAVQFHTARPVFRAVVLHELAHLRNRDIDKTYLAISTSVAFTAVVLIPYTAALLIRGLAGSWDWVFHLGWRAAALALLVYLSLSAVLRAREFYADVRASLWDGPAGALRSVLAAQREVTLGRWLAWRRAFRTHPSPAMRRQVLDDTRPLFHMGWWEALGAGVATTVAFQDVAYLLSLVIPMWGAVLRPLGAALVFAPLAVGVVGLGIWRRTFAALADGLPVRGVTRLALAMWVGLVIGQNLSFASFALSRTELTLPMPTVAVPLDAASGAAFGIAWYALLLVGLIVFLRWIAAGASVWLEVTVGRSPRGAYRTGLALASVLLALWMALLFFVDAIGIAGGDRQFLSTLVPEVEALGVPIAATQDVLFSLGIALSDTSVLLLFMAVGSAALVVTSPIAVAVLVCCWAYPLGAWIFRRRRQDQASWTLLDGTDAPLPLTHADALRAPFALAVGAIGGAATGGLLVLVSSGLLAASGTTTSELFVPWMVFGQPALSIMAQSIVAAIVASRVSRLPVVHALFAGCVTGALAALCVLGFSLYVWGGADPGFAWTLAWVASGWAINVGGVTAMACAAVFLAVTRTFGTLRARRALSRMEHVPPPQLTPEAVASTALEST